MPKSASMNSARRKTLALDLARDGLMGGGFALLLVVWLYTTNIVIHHLALTGGETTEALLTIVLAIGAELAVGAALSGVVFRMLSQKK